MIADSWRHVERDYDLDSFHSSHSWRSKTGCLGERRPAPAIGRVQTQSSPAEIEQPGSIILDQPLFDLAGLEIRVDIRSSGDRNILASKTVQTTLVEVIPA
jgi:hypothetical protein